MSKFSRSLPPSTASVVGFPSSSKRSLQASGLHLGERIIIGILFAAAALSVAVTTAIVFSLVGPTARFFSEVSVFEFFGGTLWAPGFANPAFGVWPIVVGTLIVVVVALLVAIPVGLGAAIFLSEYASTNLRRSIKPVLEVLEGIPTVATALFAFFWLKPAIEAVTPFLPWEGPFSIGVAGIAVGILIVPNISSVSDDAMRSVPRSLREGAYAMGASKMRVATAVVIPAATSGIIAAIVLGASRAVGETMVVLVVAGAGNPNLSFDLTKGIQTMTSYIAGTATGDIPQGSLVYDTIFAVGSLLFVMTLAMNMVAISLVRRFREVYE